MAWHPLGCWLKQITDPHRFKVRGLNKGIDVGRHSFWGDTRVITTVYSDALTVSAIRV